MNCVYAWCLCMSICVYLCLGVPSCLIVSVCAHLVPVVCVYLHIFSMLTMPEIVFVSYSIGDPTLVSWR